MNLKLLPILFLAMFAAPCNSAYVDLSLELDPLTPGCVGCTLSGPGTFQLFAQANKWDNFGIASYSIPLQNVETVLHRSPRAAININEEPVPAGFTFLRTANNNLVIPGGFLVRASQDIVTPTPFLVRGFGQQSGSFADRFPSEQIASPITQPSWNSKLLLAEGTYFRDQVLPHIDYNSVDARVHVFSNAAGTATKPAALILILPPWNVGDAVVEPNLVQFPDGKLTATLPLLGHQDAIPVRWSLESFTGSGPILNAPTIDPLTGLFAWDFRDAIKGEYVAKIRATDEQASADVGTLVIVLIPEPASLLMFGTSLAVFSLVVRKQRGRDA